MRYYRIIFTIGLWIIIIPFLGVPLIAKKILLVMPGIFLLLLGIIMSQERHMGAPDAGISYQDSNPDGDVFTEIEDEDEDEGPGDEEGEEDTVSDSQFTQ